MALTHNFLAQTVWGDKRVQLVETTFDNSYPTGGEPITPAEFGLSAIDAVIPVMSAATGHVPSWDRANAKLLMRWSAAAGSALSEVTNATNLSTAIVHLIVVGR